jgi:hypothetical protein
MGPVEGKIRIFLVQDAHLVRGLAQSVPIHRAHILGELLILQLSCHPLVIVLIVIQQPDMHTLMLRVQQRV